MGVDPKGGVVSRRAKFVFFQWVGPSVPAMKRMQASSAKAAVAGYFRGHHMSMEINERAELNAVDLEKRLRACGGAHQPDHFEFGTGSSLQTYDAESQPGPWEAGKSSPSTGGAGSKAEAPAAVPVVA